MQTTTPDTTADLMPPRLGSGPAAEGRKAALRSFYNHFNDLSANMLTDLDRVQNGTAPAAFKDAFRETLMSLTVLFDSRTR